MNRRDERGEWVESSPVFEQRDGVAVADRLQFQIQLEGNSGKPGYVHTVLPDGRTLRSHVLALRYFNSLTREAVVLATVRSAKGYLVGKNQVVFPDCFEGVKADLRYTVTVGGFEQDVLLATEAGLPSPLAFGFDPKYTRLEVVTEFLNPATHVSRAGSGAIAGGAEIGAMVSEAFRAEDRDIDWGSMTIGTGKAFQASGPTVSGEVFVGKRWLRLDAEGRVVSGVQTADRQFLVEAVEWSTLSAAQPSVVEKLPPERPLTSMVLPDAKALPAAPTGNGAPALSMNSPSPALLATLSTPRLVLDYYLQLSGVTFTNYVFRSDTTYLITGINHCYGTTTLEGGSVIKMDLAVAGSAPYHTLQIHGPVNCNTAPYLPVVFTARDDNSVGAAATGSTGVISGSAYGSGALSLGSDAPALNLKYVRFSYNATALALNNGQSNRLCSVQFFKDNHALQVGAGSSVYLGNALLQSCNEVSAVGSSSTALYEHVTADRCTNIHPAAYLGGSLTLRNCLVVTNATKATGDLADWSDGGGNRWPGSTNGVFAQAMGGYHYLAPGSPYRDAGVTNIDARLAAELATLTTESPLGLPTVITNDLVLAPVVNRDGGVPDIGYHYVVLDYACRNNTVVGARVTATNGVALGYCYGPAFYLGEASTFMSTGLPNRLNMLAQFQLVQESPLDGDLSWGMLAVKCATTVHPVISLRFTAANMFGGSGCGSLLWLWQYSGQQTYFPVTSFAAKDCQFANMWIYFVPATVDPVSISLINNAFVGGVLQIFRSPGGYNTNTPLAATLQNNLFYRTKVNLSYSQAATINPPWVATDNVFDQGGYNHWVYTTLTPPPAVVDYNGFANTTPAGGTHNINLGTGSATYASGLLGPWYSTTTNWVNAGSRSATNAGLFHYTTQASQEKEGATKVDLGFHYIATAWDGSPADSDGNGLADYIENPAGDGAVPKYDFLADMARGKKWAPPVATGSFPVLEVLGYQTPVSATYSFYAPPNAKTLWFRMQGLGFQDKGAVTCSQTGSSVSLNNTTCVFDYPASKSGGMGGPYAVLSFRMPGLSFVPGAWNTLTFTYTKSDNLSIGYRVLEVRVLDPNGQPMQTVADDSNGGVIGTVTRILGAANTPVLPMSAAGSYTSADAETGKWLWTNATLVEFPGGAPILAGCADCHATDGSDLKFFGYSDYSIYHRSRFHGLDSTQASQIAAYIRSSPEPTVGTPWDPPYQPGPGQSSRPYVEWAAGAGLKWVAPQDSMSWGYMFNPTNIQVSFTNTLNMRDMPVALQLPIWNEWLPMKSPKDSHPTNYAAQVVADNFAGALGTTKLGDVVIYLSEVSGWAYRTDISVPSITADGNTADDQIRSYSFARWLTVRLWELMHTHRLEGNVAPMFPSYPVDPHSWYTAFVFHSAPHFRINHENIPLWDHSVATWELKSHQWYWLQMVLNDANHHRENTAPIDFPYLLAFSTAGGKYGFDTTAQTVAALIKSGESGTGDPYDGAPAGGPYTPGIRQNDFSGFGVTRLEFLDAVDGFTHTQWQNYAPLGRDAIARAVVTEHDRYVRQLGREYFRDKTGEIQDGETYNWPSAPGSGPWIRGHSAYFVRMRDDNFAPDILNTLHNQALYLWPAADWSAY
ncbi:MAG TPA: hypothetical protein VMF06_02425 [Candidatus Limnocylindria bacterium]|nr:hypothetical protein [Candidatus Limnocylindria bacterium]